MSHSAAHQNTKFGTNNGGPRRSIIHRDETPLPVPLTVRTFTKKLQYLPFSAILAENCNFFFCSMLSQQKKNCRFLQVLLFSAKKLFFNFFLKIARILFILVLTVKEIRSKNISNLVQHTIFAQKSEINSYYHAIFHLRVFGIW